MPHLYHNMEKEKILPIFRRDFCVKEEEEMENKKNFTIIAGVEALVAIFMWVAVTRIAPVCSGMLELVSGKQVHMKCYYTAVVFVFVAVLLLVNAIVAIFAKPSLVSGVMTIALAAVVFVVLNDSIGIGICVNPDMACHMTAPFAKVSATVEIICGLVYIFFGTKKEK